jgi:DNA-binding transcriptional MerR regulator
MGLEDPVPDKRFFGIREAADLCGVEPHVLRFWEEAFPDLAPERRAGNRRAYRPDDVRLARRIRYLLRDCRYTLEGARRRLEDDEPEAAEPGRVLREVRGELAAILRELDRPAPGPSSGSAS